MTILSCHCAKSFDPTVLSVRHILWPYCPLSSLYPLTLLPSQFGLSFNPTVLSVRYILRTYCPDTARYPLTLLSSQFAIFCDPTVLTFRYILWPYCPRSLLQLLPMLSCQFAMTFDTAVLSDRYCHTLCPYRHACFTVISCPPTYTRVVISSKNVDWYTIVLPQLDSSSITSYMRECFYTEIIQNCINQKAQIGLRTKTLCKGTHSSDASKLPAHAFKTNPTPIVSASVAGLWFMHNTIPE